MNLFDKNNREEFCTNILVPIIKSVAKKCDHLKYDIEKKGQGNFVTTADRSIEQELMKNLRMLLPGAGFVTEESGESCVNGFNWIIDPIDGTTNYIYGLPYAISVALEFKPKKEILMGIVYNPRDELLYYACKDTGSYLIRHGIKKKLHVNKFAPNEGIAIFGMPYDRKKSGKILKIAEKYYAQSSDLKRIGPASLDICMVATGQVKMYFELDLHIWDIAAGMLILLEAGGHYLVEDDLMIFYGDIEV